MKPAVHRNRPRSLCLRSSVLVLLLAFVPGLAAASEPVPVFSKAFTPSTIGPGSTTMLVFTIDASAHGSPVSDLAFTDTLPAQIDLAAPAFVSNSCGGTLSAPDGGSTITFSDGVVGAGQTCTIVVNVTSDDIGEGPWTNTSGNLTSSAGNSGPAIADLTVTGDRPGFSKAFSPSSVAFGGRSTLTFTIDNTLGGAVELLDFTDLLPPGMVIAGPANAATDCGGATSVSTLIAVPGTTTIILDANGTVSVPALGAGATCTVTVDVIGGAVGLLGNVSGELLLDLEVSAGKAAAVLEVTGAEGLLELRKEFLDDPVAPGGTVTLQFTVFNRSRDEAATGITFSDNLEATLPGLTPTLPPTPDPPCGAGSALTFGAPPPVGPGPLPAAMVLTLTGGSLPPESSCTFSVELTVPAGATPGAYPNTAGPVSGTVGGEPETGDSASDLLFVVPFPVLTKEFTDDPVGAGGTVTLEFTITNPASSPMDDIEFIDELTDGSGGFPPDSTSGFLPFPVSVTLPPVPDPPCGPSSSLALVSVGTDREGLSLTGGSLAANDLMPGGPDTCSFTVTVDIPEGFASGMYTNTTEEITATIVSGPMATGAPAPAESVTGPPASDDIVIVGAPQITKEFTDDPVAPGGVVTLEFTLQNLDPDNAASAIAFSDDLGATLAGLTLSSVLFDDCAGTPSGVGTSVFGYSGGSLAADSSCTIRVALTVPGSPPGGLFTNTTSDLTATVLGVSATSLGASDDLLVTGLLFSKAFSPDTVLPGGTTTLTFTLDNTTGLEPASAISFSDDLDAALSGLMATGAVVNSCGGMATSMFPTGGFSYAGGSLAAGDSCEISLTVAVPVAAANGSYLNITSDLDASIGGPLPTAGTRTSVPVPVTLPPATDRLTVESDLLALSKEFIDDPAVPGGTVTLKFTLENLSATETITDIEFTDNLNAALSGLEATGATSNSCGGMATSGFPTGLFGYVGGMLGPGASCMIVLTLDVPPAPLPGSVFTNTTSPVTGRTGVCPPLMADAPLVGPPLPCVFGDPASDDLVVRLLTLTKSFDGPATATGTAVLTFTLTNLDTSGGVTGLGFSDDLSAVIAGLTASLPPTPNPPCGAGSSLAGISFLALSNGSLAAAGAPGDSCTFSVTVDVPVSASGGSFLNQTSSLFASGLSVAGPATASLEIEPPPTFAKEFAPNPVGETFDTTLTFSIGNTASGLEASDLDFADTLPFDLVVAALPAVANSCGGDVVAAPGSTSISLANGSVAAGATCEISVRVNAPSPGAYVNTTGDLTSTSGNSGTANDTLTVNPCGAPDGLNLSLGNDVVLGSETYEVCKVIEVIEHYQVLGPGGMLLLRAGLAVVVFDGVEFGGTVTIDIDPSLIP